MNPKTSDQTLDGGTRAGEADGSLGQQLSRAREARGISLRDISEQTRITMRHLEAIESSDYKHLPGGIFNRSFIKAYARLIDFPEQRALDLYAREARERGETEEVATSPRRSHVYTGDVSRSPAMTALLTAIVLGLLVLIVYAGLHWYRRTGDDANANAPAANANAATGAPAQPAAQTQPPAADEAGFRIQLKAKDRGFWLLTRADEAKEKGRILNLDKPEDLEPQDRLYLRMDKASAGFLEVTVNGRPLKTPPAGAGNEVEWTITKENYRQFLP
ncbi:MAG TPA: helix-turn-helix domain-containing protein [Pyrinomonadaceae bacterium]